MSKVILEHVFKIFPGDVVAVNDVCLEIEDREFVVLVGPSGCGKSTTLRMVAGLEDISKGNIYIDGIKVNDVPSKNRNIAMVFQNYALYPHLNVYANMALGLQLRRYPRTEIESRVKKASEILGISKLLSRLPKELSGGQRQRVAVGRAIVRKPKAFLFDEPLSNLDAQMRVQMRTEISKLHARLESTMIYVTHDQTEAMTMGDRIVVMKDGLIQQVDDPLALYNHPANRFVAGFIGSPPMNFFDGIIEQKNGGIYFKEGDVGKGTFSIRVDEGQAGKLSRFIGKTIIFGVRVEDVRQIHVPDPEHEITAKVEVMEPMGAEVLLYLNTGLHSFISRSETYDKALINRQIALAVDVRKAHFFDHADGQSLME